jgi:hypothetical protein
MLFHRCTLCLLMQYNDSTGGSVLGCRRLRAWRVKANTAWNAVFARRGWWRGSFLCVMRRSPQGLLAQYFGTW